MPDSASPFREASDAVSCFMQILPTSPPVVLLPAYARRRFGLFLPHSLTARPRSVPSRTIGVPVKRSHLCGAPLAVIVRRSSCITCFMIRFPSAPFSGDPGWYKYLLNWRQRSPAKHTEIVTQQITNGLGHVHVCPHGWLFDLTNPMYISHINSRPFIVSLRPHAARPLQSH